MKLYNENWKNQYLAYYKNEKNNSSRTVNNMKYMFSATSDIEERLGKDLSQFTTEEYCILFRERLWDKLRTFIMSRSRITLYVEWCIDQKYIPSVQAEQIYNLKIADVNTSYKTADGRELVADNVHMAQSYSPDLFVFRKDFKKCWDDRNEHDTNFDGGIMLLVYYELIWCGLQPDDITELRDENFIEEKGKRCYIKFDSDGTEMTYSIPYQVYMDCKKALAATCYYSKGKDGIPKRVPYEDSDSLIKRRAYKPQNQVPITGHLKIKERKREFNNFLREVMDRDLNNADTNLNGLYFEMFRKDCEFKTQCLKSGMLDDPSIYWDEMDAVLEQACIELLKLRHSKVDIVYIKEKIADYKNWRNYFYTEDFDPAVLEYRTEEIKEFADYLIKW